MFTHLFVGQNIPGVHVVWGYEGSFDPMHLPNAVTVNDVVTAAHETFPNQVAGIYKSKLEGNTVVKDGEHENPLGSNQPVAENELFFVQLTSTGVFVYLLCW